MDIRRRMLFKKKASSGGGSTAGGSYTVELNGQWEATTAVPNPDPTLYDGVYRSSSNYNVNNGVATMYITIKDCSSFKMYIRSYAESNYDYVMVSQLDQTINGSTSYSNTTLVKAHTRGNQQSGTALSNYTLVEFTGITSGEHTITVVYRKDSNAYSGDDRGYVLIEKLQPGSGDSGGDDEGPINTDNYLTIEALENGLTASLSTNACEYCVDGDGNWKTLSAGTATESINTGHTLSFRGELTPNDSNGIGTFTISKKCNLKGNCMSMLFGDNADNNYSLSGKDFAFYKLFYNCKNIVNISSNFLPATTLMNYCYSDMFRDCTSLTTAPELPATTLAIYCYYHMFDGCANLKTAPELPATTLVNGCYRNMFDGCTNLKTAPELPATTLAIYCYSDMFRDCTSLTTAPELPATTLKNNCYSSMFEGCTSLTTAPELPAMTLANGCYRNMFYDCTSLKTAPELSATTLISYCYSQMFYDCTKLNYIKMLATNITENGCLSSWVYGVATTGTFVKNSAMIILSTGTSGIPSGWTVVDAINTDNYLTIEALENGLTASLSTNACEYCIDGNGIWKTLAAGTATQSINSGQTLSFRGNLTPALYKGIGTFTVNKKCNLKGNCVSMLFGDNVTNNYSLSGKRYAFYQLFYNCTNIVNVSENFLPATTLAESCYCDMFRGCTSLITAPALPATTLALNCYDRMFYNCTSLTTAPELPATTLAYSCYHYMFYNCTSLTTAPELPATTLAHWCYNEMFHGCSKLNYIKMLATDISAQSCLGTWVIGVASTGKFVKNPAMTSLTTGISGIPSGWTVVNDGELITFTPHLIEYQAEAGMTWGEWVDSKYNVDGFTIKNDTVYYPDGIHYIGYLEMTGNGNYYIPVSITDIISSTIDYLYIGGDDGSGD